MRVITWNVLHRVHAVNWSEPCIAHFPDERVRLEAIAVRVAAWLREGVDAVCLQEVSGDQLAALGELPVATHRYPRVPRLRDGGASPLVDSAEHLVTVTRKPARLISSRTFDNDPGKGFLAVDVGGLTLVNTHVTFSTGGTPQLALLSAEARPPSVVVGDFNAPAPVVAAGLGAGFVLADLAGRTTRVSTPQYPDGKAIDHVAARGVRIITARVLDAEGLSDHHPVEATLDA